MTDEQLDECRRLAGLLIQPYPINWTATERNLLQALVLVLSELDRLTWEYKSNK